MGSPKRLLAVLANPPQTTSGLRTHGRVAMAGALLGCEEASIVNLFGTPSRDVTAIGALGRNSAAWAAARPAILLALAEADDVLLGWGCTEPTGSARLHHREQVSWLIGLLRDQSRQAWMVGARPRHPSRWQRYTAKCFPGMTFADGLAAALMPAALVDDAERQIRLAR